MKAALYARVSTKDQVDGYSLDAQVRAFRSLVKDRDWVLYREYIEEGRSAHTENVRKRPVFLQAIEDALAGRYDVIVVHRIDRFSRRQIVTMEYFQKLAKADVGFVSIENNMDFSTPEGKLMLGFLSGLAEYYSDNLSKEVRKGKTERKAQGKYNGLLPFGATKDDDGVPIPHPETITGLKIAFDLASQGRSDREVAIALNCREFRTAGNRGPLPFTKDSVRGMLINRFYIGELTDGNGGWVDGRHEPFIDPDVFEQAQETRVRNRKNPKTIKRTARTYSLSGVMQCHVCESPMWIHSNSKGRARIYCRQRAKGVGCENKGTFLDVYEAQVMEYLRRLVIPEDYQSRILEMYQHLQEATDDSEQRRSQLEGRLKRIKNLYEWGDKPEEEYKKESLEIKTELENLTPPQQRSHVLETFRELLADIPGAWERGTDEQRNKLARQIFDTIWTKDEKVVAVRPRAELRPFFQLSEECQEKVCLATPTGVECARG